LFGQPARDVARHFIQRWNYSVSTRFKSYRFQHILPALDYTQVSVNIQKSPNLNVLTSPKQQFKSIVNKVRAVQKIGNLIKGSKSPGDRGFSQYSSRDEFQDEVQDCNSADPVDLSMVHYSMSPFISPVSGNTASNSNRSFGYELEPPNEAMGFNCSCQIVRSISLWSGGCPTERSIQNAYIRLINGSSHFIYIEVVNYF